MLEDKGPFIKLAQVLAMLMVGGVIRMKETQQEHLNTEMPDLKTMKHFKKSDFKSCLIWYFKLDILDYIAM